MQNRQFLSQKVINPANDEHTWLVVDSATLVPVASYTAFVKTMQSQGLSTNTQKAYANRVARFLSWCVDNSVYWQSLKLDQMSQYKNYLTNQSTQPSASTLKGHLTAVFSFLKHGVTTNTVDAQVLNQLSVVRPHKGSTNKSKPVRTLNPVLFIPQPEIPPEVLSTDQVRALIKQTGSDRDRFLVILLWKTGLRIGEALGLHRGDMHVLNDSRSLLCSTKGPHIHVSKRKSNSNGATAKSKYPRVVPLDKEVVNAYHTYFSERDKVLSQDTSDYVFVNYHGPSAGLPMGYENTLRVLQNTGKKVGVAIHPHMLRHTAATNWVRSGVDIDVVRQLLGHASLTSTNIYLHPGDKEMRDAVDKVEGVTKDVRN